MDEPISENAGKSGEKNKILTRVAILLCISLIVILGWGIYASKNIRLAESKNGKLVGAVYLADAPKTLSKPVSESQSKMLRVSKVVDGDTIVVESMPENNLSKNALQKTTVRLIGINTPETVDPRKKVECFGMEASAKAKELLLGKTVRLEYDDTQDSVDKYGRKLAYVFIQDEAYNSNQASDVANTDTEIFFNKYMIEQGYAYEYTYSKPYKYQKEFKDAQRNAEIGERGLWSTVTYDRKKSI